MKKEKLQLNDLVLQPLIIPTGWLVSWNQFYDLQPYSNLYIEGLPDGDIWELFLQDLLQLKHINKNLILDLGWIPEADPEGSYHLELVANEDWSNPIFTYESKDKNKIVAQLNNLLISISYDRIST